MYQARLAFLCEFLAYFSDTSNCESQGLYGPDGSPLFPNGMATSAINPANPRKQRVRSPRLVIIEFVLDDLSHMGTTGQLLYLSLAQNYVVAPGRLHHELIFFEIDPNDLDKHTKRMSEIVVGLQKRCAISLTFVPLAHVHVTGVLTMLW